MDIRVINMSSLLRIVLFCALVQVCLSLFKPLANPNLGNDTLRHGHGNLRHHHAMNTLDKSMEAALSIDCDALLNPIRQRRDQCLTKSVHEVGICVYFASDYNYVIPFLIHHLSLGFSKIWIYNNDEKTTWFRHPTVQCLMNDGHIDIQPWYGENGLHKGLDHCFEHRLTYGRKGKDMSKVWGAVFDIDELLVLHKDECIGPFVERIGEKAPSIAVNWAFFTPEMPLNAFSRTGNPAYMTEAHYDTIKTASGITHIENDVILPHDMLIRRMYENRHVKSISRVACAGKWVNEHCPNRKDGCPIESSQSVDPQGKFIDCGPWTPWVDNVYPVAQLNHYWTLSLADFLRKIHRGKGGSYSRNFDASRNTGEFFEHGSRGPQNPQPFVNDTTFHGRYGRFFNDLKHYCPRCFDTSLYYV